jgi:hypothetical protein
MKAQWIDHFAELSFVDGIEFYSIETFDNPKCGLSVVPIPRLSRKFANPSAYLLWQILRNFLERSDAGWLFLIGDAAYVKIEKLEEYLKKWMKGDIQRIWARGSCVERRYYFQMLSIQSGILITRNTVEELLVRDEMWNVTMETGIPAEEALSQILDDVGVIAKASKEDWFLGQPFRNWSFHDDLLEKRSDHLKVCERPDLKPSEAAIAAVCSGEITRFSNLIVWAGGGKNATTKEWFLTHAKEMMEGLPDNLHFIWDRLFPELCRTE